MSPTATLERPTAAAPAPDARPAVQAAVAAARALAWFSHVNFSGRRRGHRSAGRSVSLIFGRVRPVARGVSVRPVYRGGVWIGDAMRRGRYATVIRGEDGRAVRWTLREGPVLALAMVHEGIRLL